MIEHIPSFKQLLRSLQQVPYLASKNIYRVANYFLSLDQAKAEQFCKAILDAKKNIMECDTCCTWKEKDLPCTFCVCTIKLSMKKGLRVMSWHAACQDLTLRFVYNLSICRALF